MKNLHIGLQKKTLTTHNYVRYAEEMFEELGKPISKELWNTRADYQLNVGNHNNALRAYQIAGNAKGVDLVQQTFLAAK